MNPEPDSTRDSPIDNDEPEVMTYEEFCALMEEERTGLSDQQEAHLARHELYGFQCIPFPRHLVNHPSPAQLLDAMGRHAERFRKEQAQD